ncbi:MAG: hypothetical protein JST26_02550 [Bacteroidetes bacterium]|nr:hypothetical protein [Bacteroidota bacterium]
MRRIITYLLVLVLLAYALHWFLMEGMRRNSTGIYGKYTTTFVRPNTYNTIMLGSSRMFMHLDNELFDSITGTNSYNIGLPGATTRMSYACLRAYCVNSKLPETVFYELDFHISHLETDTVYNFTTYFPYLGNEELYSRFTTIDSRFRGFRYVPFYSLPYSGIPSLSAAIHGWFGKEGYYDHYFRKGFFRNELMDDYNNVRIKKYNGYIGRETRDYLDSLILFCREKHISLHFTMSPVYRDSQSEVLNRDRIIEQYGDIATMNRIMLWDYSRDTAIVNHKVYFEDNYHMLYPGARLYTRKIAVEYHNISGH